jgi:hypothetical protein
VINRDPAPPKSRVRSRRVLTVLAVVVIILIFAIRSIAVFWTDFLWFDSLKQTDVWRTLVFTRVWLVLGASVFAFGVFWFNLYLADRLSPRQLAYGGSPDEELLERFQEWISPRVGRVRLLVASFFGIMLGLGAAAWWESFLLWRHGGAFGIDDPIFGNDLSTYVFDLPFYRNVFGWAFQLVLVVKLVTAAVHYLNGGIQVQEGRRVNPGVKVHLSVLLAILALLKAVGYLLDRWELLYSARGQVIGASYTDVNAQLPALNLLILISLVSAVILLVNLRFRGWTLPLVAVGLWLVTSIVVGGLYPTLIQRFRVEPNEKTLEVEFVAHNIDATLAAYGMDSVEVLDFAASPDLTSADLVENDDTIDNIRLWDPGVLSTTFSELQEIRTFYAIEDVDVDRYVVDERLTQVMVSGRELDENNIPGGGWVNERLVYTHGFGAVMSRANDVTTEGRPVFLIQDLPPVSVDSNLEVDQSRIYFSDRSASDHLIAGTNQPEVDFPSTTSGTVETNSYDGSGGVALGNFVRRAAWALRFGEIDTLISDQLTTDSKVLLERNVRSRLEKVAPFLHADSDPYLVLLEGRLGWVVDMYTLTRWYPYAADADTSRLNQSPGLPNDFNYIRNSVKAVVDAYNGTITLYVVDPTDPMIRAQQKIFPSLFTSGDEMPDELRAHLRYPEDLFRIQSDIYRLYHVTDAGDFFSNVDPWQIAIDPSTSVRTPLRNTFVDDQGQPYRPMLPYYLLMRLPDDENQSFILMQPFTPRNRPNMVSFLVAKSDPGDYGEIVDYTFPTDTAQPGPGQVGDFINQDTEISAQFTLLGQGGSEVIQGNMLVVPIEESLLYVQPIYVNANSGAAAGGSSGIPEVKRVVVSFNGQIEMRDTLGEALSAIFGLPTDPTTPGEPGTPLEGTVGEQVAQLVEEANLAFVAADAALRAGDLAGYAEQIAIAESKIRDATDLINAAQGTVEETAGATG